MIIEQIAPRSQLQDILVPLHYLEDEWIRYQWTIVFLFSNESIQLSVDQSCLTFESVSPSKSSWVIKGDFDDLQVRWVTTLASPVGKLISAIEYFDPNAKGQVLWNTRSFESSQMVALGLQGESGSIWIRLDYDKIELLSGQDFNLQLNTEYRDVLLIDRVDLI